MSTCIETLSPVQTTSYLTESSFEAHPYRVKSMVQAPNAHKVANGGDARSMIRSALLRGINANEKSAFTESFDTETLVHDNESESAFFVADLGEVYRQHRRWTRNLPRVIPHYAVKCNPDHRVIELLASLGTGFDCASKAEIGTVLSLGVSAERIIYANPCKASSHIKYAGKVGVQAVTFDNADELHKLAKFNPSAQLYLRILTDDSGALCQLGLKYGAALSTTSSLLSLARDLGLDVVGVSFHIGSGSNDPYAFLDAIYRARQVFDDAIAFGFTMHTLDIGGGFGHDNFESFAKVLAPALDASFDSSIRIIAEPGRYYVANAFTLAVQIIARRTIDHENYMYYINDGVYGSFNCIMFDHQHPKAQVLTQSNRSYYNVPTRLEHVRCSIWGPTCDSLDCVTSETTLPVLDIGDWLYFEEMGAYTKCAASTFNGFSLSGVTYIDSEAVSGCAAPEDRRIRRGSSE